MIRDEIMNGSQNLYHKPPNLHDMKPHPRPLFTEKPSIIIACQTGCRFKADMIENT